MRRLTGGLLALCMLLGLTACGGAPAEETGEEAAEKTFFAMDTTMRLDFYGTGKEEALAEAEREIYRLEDLLSRTREESEITRLNRAGGAETALSGEVCGLLSRAQEFSRAAGGAFDITVAPVVDAWQFTEEQQRVPSQEELDRLLPLVDPDLVAVGEESASLAPGVQIDLGGIAKGYASDRMGAICREHQLSRAMIYLGGNVLVVGNRPDETPWRVAVQDPENPEGFAAILQLTDSFAVTSGGYQRFFEQDGKTYHHILDPETGYPADSGLLSVTIVAEGREGNGTMCDALSTALFVMGEERALEFWRTSGLEFQAVLVTDDGRVVATGGLADRLIPVEESGYTYETVS